MWGFPKIWVPHGTPSYQPFMFWISTKIIQYIFGIPIYGNLHFPMVCLWFTYGSSNIIPVHSYGQRHTRSYIEPGDASGVAFTVHPRNDGTNFRTWVIYNGDMIYMHLYIYIHISYIGYIYIIYIYIIQWWESEISTHIQLKGSRIIKPTKIGCHQSVNGWLSLEHLILWGWDYNFPSSVSTIFPYHIIFPLQATLDRPFWYFLILVSSYPLKNKHSYWTSRSLIVKSTINHHFQ